MTDYHLMGVVMVTWHDPFLLLLPQSYLWNWWS